ncbi:beta-glucosidase BglX [Hyphobacterium sp. CCMP332]|nr:beta-glucosidase BglX [Hyphobacterium sp. CCMP332]
MKIKFLLISVLVLSFLSCKKEDQEKSQKNMFLDSLMAKMTLEEKIGQLNMATAGHIVTGQATNSDIAENIRKGNIGALLNITKADNIRQVQKIAVEESRLKIPLLFGLDVIHGYRTIFPIPIGLSCSWDMALIQNSARIAAQEASADGICWTFSPMVDLSRDPRWGRVAEGAGEDPYLGAEIAKAMVYGYQGDDLTKNNTLLSCVKHFALYGASEGGRDYNTVDMSRVKMFNVYFPPYKAAIDAGAGSVMTSFNEVEGIPTSAHKWLLDDVLRKRWGFDGIIFTDYTGISEMIKHGIGDLQEVSARAINAGLDMDMVSEGYLKTLKKSVDEGKVDVSQIEKSCRRILEAKYKLGLFDDPYKYCDPERAKTELYTNTNRQISREIAARSMVLLKNDKDILPLKEKGKIAIIGPLGDNRENMCGTWSVSGQFDKAISLKDGIEKRLGDKVEILLAKGSNIVEDPALENRISTFGKPTYRSDRPAEEMIKEAVDVAKKADVIIAAVGEAAEYNGECSSRSDLELPNVQRDLLKALVKLNKPIVMVLFTGRPLSIGWEKENIPSILNVWFAGSEAGDAIADVLFGDVNPSGKLTMSFPRNVGQVPVYYNHKNTGRPLEGEWFEKFKSSYIDIPNEPLYPFGYGLSYTTFDYSNLRLSSESIKMGEELNVSVDVKNTGKRNGEEVVQLYIRDLFGSITRPVKELKGFKKIKLDAGQTKTVEFTLNNENLSFYNSDLEFVAESGEFKVFVGGNSVDLLEGDFVLE